MRKPSLRRRIVLGFLCAGVLSGCAGGETLLVKDSRIEELKRRNADQERSLDQLEERIRQLQISVKARTYEKEAAEKSLAEKTADLQKRLRETKQDKNDIARQKVKIESRLIDKDRAYDKLRQTLELHRQDSSKYAGEAADLGIRVKDLTARESALRKSSKDLREHNRNLQEQLVAARSKLQKADAVVRSLTENDANEKAVAVNLQVRVRRLEFQNKDFRDENSALVKKMQLLTAQLPQDPVEHIPLAPGKIYEDDAAGLWTEVQGFVGRRVEAMIAKDSKWDRVDIGLVAFAGVGLFSFLWLLWTPVRRKKRKAMRCELDDLRERREEMESRDGDAGAAARPRRARRSGSTVRRSGQFSPIISSEPTPAEGIQLPALEPQDADQTVVMGAGGAGRSHGGAARGSNVIGARQWDDAEEESRDGFDQTQVISGVSNFDLGISSASPARDPLASAARPESPESDGADDDEEFGNTQIMPSLDKSLADPVAPAADSSGGKQSTSSQDLMNELEDLIGKKVDELIK